MGQRGQRKTKRAQKPALMFHESGDDPNFDAKLEALWATDRRRATTTLSSEALRRSEATGPNVFQQVEQMKYPISNLSCAFVNKNIKVLSFPVFFSIIYKTFVIIFVTV